jgi:hypothetical protein
MYPTKDFSPLSGSRMAFEPTQTEPIGYAVQRLNHLNLEMYTLDSATQVGINR